ncbi:MAG: bifunctional phosphopantothenoylcysteine decarboxylase/phosphopantothenate--cysteine ligase CoaBC [Desulfobacteraceae bacterium]|nr:MAG: bifunctional phosphopantothenoylcysteine decarboxylase/phosphopantothenate--cysteine ligase CoaBC [Desulfobacteraceae bacterium]
MHLFKGLKIVLGVTGGIAAYKAVELLRRLTDAESRVAVIMTGNARRFIAPLTFQALTPEGVYTELFDAYRPGAMDHIQLAQWADLVVLAPATANSIGKAAGGMADDLLSTFLLACSAPKLICPAMNVRMYENPAVQANLALLKKRGAMIQEPAPGFLACGDTGKGRLADLEDILEAIQELRSPKDLKDERVLITTGCTQEPLDPVRFLSNYSTGKMGFALARVARRRGARVTLVSGPTYLPPPKGITHLPVGTAREMEAAVLEAFPRATTVIKAAAVSDYRPEEQSDRKIKKTSQRLTLSLVPNPDILKQLGRLKQGQFLVGFAAETDHLLKNAEKKLKEKNLDLMVANPIGVPGAGFGSETNRVHFLYPGGRKEPLPLMSKEGVASEIFDRVLQMKRERR